MVSASKLRETMTSLMSECVPAEFPFDKVAAKMRQFEDDNEIRLSEYGYVMWAVDHYGWKCAYKNLMASDDVVQGYMDEALKYMLDMPILLVNANKYLSKLLGNIANFETCLQLLEGMSYPYILYTLFAGIGQADRVARYRPEMEEQMRRYPSTLDKLPESFRKVGEEVLDENAD